VFHYVAAPADLQRAGGELLDLVKRGQLKAEIGGTWPLAEVAKVHRLLEGRATTGSLVLVP